jgi:putative transposase
MPAGLRRYQQARQLHYITFTCYHRAPYLATAAARELFESTLERVRCWYGYYINAYVVMPEHVHLLISEPERSSLAVALQMLKQIVSRKMYGARGGEAFWQRRYYDFNLWSTEKLFEKMDYIHSNPVRRGLVGRPEDWKWSSFRHLALGEDSLVEIGSQWTARKRERLGECPTLRPHQAKGWATRGNLASILGALMFTKLIQGDLLQVGRELRTVAMVHWHAPLTTSIKVMIPE